MAIMMSSTTGQVEKPKHAAVLVAAWMLFVLVSASAVMLVCRFTVRAVSLFMVYVIVLGLRVVVSLVSDIYRSVLRVVSMLARMLVLQAVRMPGRLLLACVVLRSLRLKFRGSMSM